jgi:outer membrane immunogenic protein
VLQKVLNSSSEAVVSKLLLVSIALIALALTGSANAADMPVKAPVYKAPPPVPAYNWTGFYIGGYGGGAWGGSVSSSDPCVANTGGAFAQGTCYSVTGGGFDAPGSGRNYFPASYSLRSSAIAGVTAGYNYQLGRAVVGLEGEAGYIHLSGSGPYTFPAAFGGPCPSFVGPCPNFTASSTFGNWYTALTARFGVTWDFLLPTLLYAKVGPAVGRFSTSATSVNTPTTTGSYQFFTSGADTVWGVAAGAGLEWAFARNWSLKGEYEYLGFHDSTRACGTLLNGSVFVFGGGVANGPVIPATTVCGSTDVPSIHTVKLGLNFRFSSW